MENTKLGGTAKDVIRAIAKGAKAVKTHMHGFPCRLNFKDGTYQILSRETVQELVDAGRFELSWLS